MNLLNNYTNDKFDIAFRLLAGYASSSDPEIIHQLRVALKKIKAVLDYLRTLHPEQIKPLRKKLQLVFHAAGSLRELQIRYEWLKEQNLLLLIQHLQIVVKIEVEENLFIAEAPRYLKKLNVVYDELDKHLKKVDEQDLLQYAQDLKTKFQNSLQNLSIDEWHAQRKLIKQLLYAYHWPKEKVKSKVLTDAAYVKLDSLQEKIGAWHDAVDLLQWLNKEDFLLSSDDLAKQELSNALTSIKTDVEVKEQIVLIELDSFQKPTMRE